MKVRTVGELGPSHMVELPFSFVEEIALALAVAHGTRAFELAKAITSRQGGNEQRSERGLADSMRLVRSLGEYVERARVKHLGRLP